MSRAYEFKDAKYLIKEFQNLLKNLSSSDKYVKKYEKEIKNEAELLIKTDYFKKIDKHIEKLQEVNSRIPVGIKEFDRMTYGGLPKDDTCLWIIMAQPGLGKSQLLGNIAYNWIRQNKKVLIISLEMSEQMYSARLSSLIAGTNINTLKNNIINNH